MASKTSEQLVESISSWIIGFKFFVGGLARFHFGPIPPDFDLSTAEFSVKRLFNKGVLVSRYYVFKTIQ
jgi:hypothetical protein